MTHRYIGGELGLFARARHWKRYLARVLAHHLVGDVLEVGAGLGATTAALCDGRQKRWLCLEPDRVMAEGLVTDIEAGRLPACCRVVAGTLQNIPDTERFNAILYIDVLEHIQDDIGELARAAARLAGGGTLIVVSPAYPALYSPFDAAIGHYRRYTQTSLAHAAPPWLEPVTLRHLDAVGLLASVANRALLRRRLPTPRSIAVWDSWLVPLSLVVDPLLGFRLGRSVLGIWRRPEGG